MVDAKDLHFPSPVVPEDIIRINPKAHVPEEDPLHEQFRIEDSMMYYFSTAGVIRGEGRLVMRSRLGITCIFETDNLGADEVARYYPPEIVEMLRRSRENRDRLSAYYDSLSKYRGIKGSLRILTENVQSLLGKRRIININRAGQVI